MALWASLACACDDTAWGGGYRCSHPFTRTCDACASTIRMSIGGRPPPGEDGRPRHTKRVDTRTRTDTHARKSHAAQGRDTRAGGDTGTRTGIFPPPRSEFSTKGRCASAHMHARAYAARRGMARSPPWLVPWERIYRSRSRRRGSSRSSFTRTRKVTASRPSIRR